METNNNLFQTIIDNTSEGFIYLNPSCEIEIINQKAKQILGITLGETKSHPGGIISPNDIVIIADNSLGEDDGNLNLDDLKLININDSDIKQNDMVIAIGVYKNAEISPMYKYLRNPKLSKNLEIETNFLGFKINVEINSVDLYSSIKVNDTLYKMTFLKSIGHIVIIDGNTGTIKFFQAKGYTLRKEAIAYILQGKTFLPKGNDIEDLNVVGRKYDDIVEKSELTDKILSMLKEENLPVIEQFYDINRRLTICSLIPFYNNMKIEGVILKFRDASELEEMIESRNQILEEVEHRHVKAFSFNPEAEGFITDFVGNSSAMKEVIYLSHKASKVKINVLLTGESGTGKSRYAHKIHSIHGKGTPFIEVNCASIPQNLFESELFGYAHGAFTGAHEKGKIGYFELANGGTIFLDEIGELPIDIQVKLLQVLQNRRFYPIGSTKEVTLNVRVIAATNMDLVSAIEKGTFRKDLYYRLNVFPINIPPLRERKSDIYLLANGILLELCNQYGIQEKQFSGMAMSKMLHYNWPGNVRELSNVIERAIALCDSNMIYPEHINIESISHSSKNNENQTLKSILEQKEEETLQETLRNYNGDKKKVMEILGLSKTSFYEKLKKYEIN